MRIEFYALPVPKHDNQPGLLFFKNDKLIEWEYYCNFVWLNAATFVDVSEKVLDSLDAFTVLEIY